jgi:hypothetical protein
MIYCKFKTCKNFQTCEHRLTKETEKEAEENDESLEYWTKKPECFEVK